MIIMKSPKHDYEKLGQDLGKLITEKQLAYGDSYGKSGEVLRQLFPDGIPTKSYTDALAIVRIIDKLFRIATDPNWGGESPWKDIAGYALLRYADTEGSQNNGNIMIKPNEASYGSYPVHISYQQLEKKCKGKGNCSKKNYNDETEANK